MLELEKREWNWKRAIDESGIGAIDESGIGKTRNCVETRRPKGGVISLNFEFFQFPRVLI